MTPPPIEPTRTVELTLVLLGIPAEQITRATELDRFRLVLDQHWLSIHRSYRIGQRADADTVSTDELDALRYDEDVRYGDAIAPRARAVPVAALLAELTDPASDIVKRVGALTDQSRDQILARFLTAGIDVARRMFGERPWLAESGPDPTDLAWVTPTPQRLDHIDPAAAKRIDPDTIAPTNPRHAHTIDLWTMDIALAPWFAQHTSIPDGPGAHYAPYIDVHTFEDLRSLLEPIDPPPGLDHLGPVRRLFIEPVGVLYVDLPPDEAEATWHDLDARAQDTGYRPVLLGESTMRMMALADAWSDPDKRIALCDPYPMDDPQSVLDVAETIDVQARLSPGGNPGYPDIRPAGWLSAERWRTRDPPRAHLGDLTDMSDAPHARVRMALVPTDAAWKAIAWLPLLLSSGEATPSLPTAVAVARRWEEEYGARVASVRPAIIEWLAPETPLGTRAARRLAEEHFYFAPEGLDSPVLNRRAETLRASRVWSAWWD